MNLFIKVKNSSQNFTRTLLDLQNYLDYYRSLDNLSTGHVFKNTPAFLFGILFNSLLKFN